MNRDGSVADPTQIASAIRKMQEDPLFVIKKKEAEHHKSLVDNPLIRERVRQMMRAEKHRETESSSSMNYPEPSRRVNEDTREFRGYSRVSRSRSPPRSRRDHHDRYREHNRRQDYRHRESADPSRQRRRSRSRSRSVPRHRRR